MVFTMKKLAAGSRALLPLITHPLRPETLIEQPSCFNVDMRAVARDLQFVNSLDVVPVSRGTVLNSKDTSANFVDILPGRVSSLPTTLLHDDDNQKQIECRQQFPVVVLKMELRLD